MLRMHTKVLQPPPYQMCVYIVAEYLELLFAMNSLKHFGEISAALTPFKDCNSRLTSYQ